MNFEVDRTDFHHTRVVGSMPPAVLANGQVLLELESFAFTANNITYAVAGDMLDYWGFFPTEAPWGRIPVMGIGRVVRSANADIAIGGRYFGFFPMSDHHVVDAAAAVGGFTDRAEHRAPHASAYRSFNLVASDPAYDVALEGEYLIARGLFITSYLVEDFLHDQDYFGVDSVLVTSASSRTSIALAHRLRARGVARVIGLTSAPNVAFVASTGLYDSVLTYDDIESLDPSSRSAVVDMAGDAGVRGRIHRHFGDNLAYSCSVGATHWSAPADDDALPGPTPSFFFAPTQMKKRSQDWGREEFDARIAAALSEFLRHSMGWMVIERSSGPAAVEAVYRSTLDGANRPEIGAILSLSDGGPNAVAADDIPVAHTPAGGWTEMPPPFLSTCTEPLVNGAPDMRGTWQVVSVEVNGADDPTHAAIGKIQRIEQCGNRVIVTASGIVHDMRADGTEENGVRDVAEFDRSTEISVVATFEHGVHVLRPAGLPIEVTRRIDGDQLVWTYVGFTACLERVEG